MDTKKEILENIKKKFRIERFEGETASNYHFRLLYSFLGRVALANLWSISDDRVGNGITTTVLKGILRKVIEGYQALFDSVNLKQLFENKDELIDNIIKDYLATGFIYKDVDGFLKPVSRQYASQENIVFIRGAEIKYAPRLSGLGSYARKKDFQNDLSLIQMFRLQEYTFEQLYEYYEKQKFVKKDDLVAPEFLQIKQSTKYTNKCWKQDEFMDDGRLNLIRVGKKSENKEYYLLKVFGDNLSFVYHLDTNLMRNKGYYNLRLALRNARGHIPTIKYKKHGKSMVEIKSILELPSSESAFIRIYSWPKIKSISDSTIDYNCRLMNTEIFKVCRELFKTMGYSFKTGV